MLHEIFRGDAFTVAEIMEIAEKWDCSRRPKPKIKPLGSFEKWTITADQRKIASGSFPIGPPGNRRGGLLTCVMNPAKSST